MKRILLVLSLLWIVVPGNAKTVAWWDFEDGTDGTTFFEMPDSGSVGLIDNITIFCEGADGPDFSSDTYSGAGICAHVSTSEEQAGFTTDETLNTWSPLEWTIEISFRMTSSYSSSYKTLIGRDGTSYEDSNAATFYFQRRGSGSENYALRLSYAIAEGEHVECLSSFIPSREQWYHAAIVCDGLQVRMYVDSLDGTGYQLIQSTDLDPSKDNRMLVPNDGAGGSWTFGRGWYGDDPTDYCSAYFDDIRFSDEALTPTQFIHSYGCAWNPAPVDGKKNYGTVIDDQAVSATLSWNTGLASIEPDQINSQIVMHYLYLSEDQNTSDDPNLYPVADIPATGDVAEFTLTDLNFDGLYLWRIEEGINDGSGAAYPKGNSNNLVGKVWQFGSLLSVPVITLQPEYQVVEAGQTAVFNVEAQSISTVQYQWYKSDDKVIDSTDEPVGLPSLSGELVLANVSISDELYYYCLTFNDGGIECSSYSDMARLVIPRQLAHLTMDELNGTVSPDMLGNYDLTIMNDSWETYLPTLTDGFNQQNGNNSMLFDNSEDPDPNYYGQYAKFNPGIVSYESITIAMWVYWKGGDSPQHIFDFASSSTEYMYITPESGNDQLHFSIKNNDSSQYLDADSIPSDQWTHIALTIDSRNTTGRLYVNGQLEDTNSDMTYRPVDFLPTSNYLGKSSWSEDPMFNGMIDNVQIFNYAVNEMDIARLFVVDAPDKSVCVQSIKPDGKFDFNDDCIINIEDFAILAAQWLDCALLPECIQ